jgi:beta-galactosidase
MSSRRAKINGFKAGYNEVFEQWAVRDIQDMVRRDRNHPSIILWSIANEVDYPNDPFSHSSLGERYEPNRPPAENLTKYGKVLVKAVKELDLTRPVTAALADVSVSNAVGFAQLFDVAGYNYQEGHYAQDHNDYPGRCIIGSENDSSLSAWEAVEDNDYISGQFIWTGIDYLGEADAWPNRSWPRALCDLCGFKKPQAWFRQSIWTDEPMVYLACRGRVRTERQEPSRRRRREVHSHWNWTEDEQIRVYCYTNCDEVELFLNGKSLSSKASSDARGRTPSWRVPFESGTLKAVGKSNGSAVCEHSLRTAGKPARIELLADTEQLIADGRDIAHIEFRIVDSKGILVPDSEVAVTFEVEGPAKIIGVGNANPNSHESHQASSHSSWQGRGLLILQSTKQRGTVTLRASVTALESDTITIKIR